MLELELSEVRVGLYVAVPPSCRIVAQSEILGSASPMLSGDDGCPSGSGSTPNGAAGSQPLLRESAAPSTESARGWLAG